MRLTTSRQRSENSQEEHSGLRRDTELDQAGRGHACRPVMKVFTADIYTIMGCNVTSVP